MWPSAEASILVRRPTVPDRADAAPFVVESNVGLTGSLHVRHSMFSGWLGRVLVIGLLLLMISIQVDAEITASTDATLEELPNSTLMYRVHHSVPTTLPLGWRQSARVARMSCSPWSIAHPFFAQPRRVTERFVDDASTCLRNTKERPPSYWTISGEHCSTQILRGSCSTSKLGF